MKVSFFFNKHKFSYNIILLINKNNIIFTTTKCEFTKCEVTLFNKHKSSYNIILINNKNNIITLKK